VKFIDELLLYRNFRITKNFLERYFFDYKLSRTGKSLYLADTNEGFFRFRIDLLRDGNISSELSDDFVRSLVSVNAEEASYFALFKMNTKNQKYEFICLLTTVKDILYLLEDKETFIGVD